MILLFITGMIAGGLLTLLFISMTSTKDYSYNDLMTAYYEGYERGKNESGGCN